MRTPLAKNVTKSLIASAIGLVLVYLFVSFRVDFENPELTSLMDWYLILCDAFTIPGLVYLMLGLLMTLSNQGALDGVGYVAINGLKMLIPGAATKMERYKEYLERRRANRIKGYGFFYVVGGIFMAVSGVFMALFYSLYNAL